MTEDLKKELGRISMASFGFGGYQDVQIGLTLQFEGNGWGCEKFDGFWAGKRSESAKWTEGDRTFALGDMAKRVSNLLIDAKARDVSELVDKPVELTFENNTLKDFRILTEVL